MGLVDFRKNAAPPSAQQSDLGLPGWAYNDADALAAERGRIFLKSWQIICHSSDLPEAGNWQSLLIMGESIVAVRGNDGIVRAFSNACRHRGARILDGHSGCTKKFVCPYHAWVYELDGE